MSQGIDLTSQARMCPCFLSIFIHRGVTLHAYCLVIDAGIKVPHGTVAENSYLAGDDVEARPMDRLLGHAITCRIAVDPRQGRKVFAQNACRWDPAKRCRPAMSRSMTRWAR